MIKKVGNPISPFVLGLLMKEDFSDTYITNKKNKIRQYINPELRKISKRLNLSVPLTMQTARDCYASTLKRSGVSKDSIGEMLGHCNSVSTDHYLDSLTLDATFKVNEKLVRKRLPEILPKDRILEEK